MLCQKVSEDDRDRTSVQRWNFRKNGSPKEIYNKHQEEEIYRAHNKGRGFENLILTGHVEHKMDRGVNG